MTPSTKVFAIISLSTAVGKKISIIESGTLAALGESLYQAGYEATRKYPYAHISASKTIQILDAVGDILTVPMEPQEILSILIAGLIDIYANIKQERKALLDPVIYCAQECLDEYDYEPDHDVAWTRYQAWVAS